MMKTLRYSTLIAITALSIGFQCLLDFGSPAQAQSAKPTPTPRVLPSGRPVTLCPTPSPTPAATPVLPTTQKIQTLDELQSRIRQRLFAPEVRRGRVGVKIVSLTTGKVIYENDADKYFMPASNMKNFTVATALERLGADHKFVTTAFASALPDSRGRIRGDLRIHGGGDVSISTAFFGTCAADPETYYKGIDRLADRIAAAGVKRIEGSIVGDDSYFKGFAIPGSWEWDDLQWYYGAEVSALPVNDNAVDLAVAPGTVGGPCIVTMSPANPLFRINNTCTTTNGSTKRELSVNKQIDRNVLDISGTMPTGDGGFRSPISVTRPAELFAELLRQRLQQRGITVTGASRAGPRNVTTDPTQIEIARLESVPLSLIAAKTMKPSQNMFTETVLWTLGENARIKNNSTADSSTLGISEMKSFLTGIGIPADGIIPHDGSGLSRHNLITPNAVVTLYTYMAKQSRNAQVWRDSLTIGGIDGTLQNRFKGTAAAGNMRGKTGTIDQVSALSGYVTTAGGEQLVVSLVVNGVAEGRQRTALIDEIVVNLANFNGRID